SAYSGPPKIETSQAPLPRAETVPDAAARGGDHRPPRRHRLDDRQRRSLVARGQGEDVEGGVDLADVACAGEDDAVGQAERGGAALELRALGAVAVDREAGEVAQPRRDAEEEIVV